MWQFVLFRGLQGLGGGAVFPVAVAVVADLYNPQERGKYLGFFGAVFGLSSILGPAIGGIITDNFGWHWIFFVNVPIGLVSLFVIFRLMPAIKRPEAARNIDYVGAALFTAAIAPILVGLSNKSVADWSDPWVGGMMLIGLVFLAVFILWESRFPEPIIPLSLFRIRTFSISVVAIFMAAFGFFSAIVFLPRWFQVVAGASATESGYQLLPLLGALIVGATLSGQIVARTHRYKWLIFGAMLLLALGLFLLTNLHASTDKPVLWVWMLIAGLGIGPSFVIFTLIVQNAVSPRDIGTASSSLSFFQQIGGTVGLTIAGTIFASRITEEIPRQLVSAGVPAQFVDQFQQAGGGGGVGPDRHGRPGCAHPGLRPRRVQGPSGALDPEHRGRHPRGLLTGDRLNGLDRHCRRDHRRHRCALPEGDTNAHDVGDAAARRNAARRARGAGRRLTTRPTGARWPHMAWPRTRGMATRAARRRDWSA